MSIESKKEIILRGAVGEEKQPNQNSSETKNEAKELRQRVNTENPMTLMDELRRGSVSQEKCKTVRGKINNEENINALDKVNKATTELARKGYKGLAGSQNADEKNLADYCRLKVIELISQSETFKKISQDYGGDDKLAAQLLENPKVVEKIVAAHDRGLDASDVLVTDENISELKLRQVQKQSEYEMAEAEQQHAQQVYKDIDKRYQQFQLKKSGKGEKLGRLDSLRQQRNKLENDVSTIKDKLEKLKIDIAGQQRLANRTPGKQEQDAATLQKTANENLVKLQKDEIDQQNKLAEAITKLSELTTLEEEEKEVTAKKRELFIAKARKEGEAKVKKQELDDITSQLNRNDANKINIEREFVSHMEDSISEGVLDYLDESTRKLSETYDVMQKQKGMAEQEKQEAEGDKMMKVFNDELTTRWMPAYEETPLQRIKRHRQESVAIRENAANPAANLAEWWRWRRDIGFWSGRQERPHFVRTFDKQAFDRDARVLLELRNSSTTPEIDSLLSDFTTQGDIKLKDNAYDALRAHPEIAVIVETLKGHPDYSDGNGHIKGELIENLITDKGGIRTRLTGQLAEKVLRLSETQPYSLQANLTKDEKERIAQKYGVATIATAIKQEEFPPESIDLINKNLKTHISKDTPISEIAKELGEKGDKSMFLTLLSLLGITLQSAYEVGKKASQSSM